MSALQTTLRAALGPTNTGKTHLAVERMLGHPTGMIGLPLRLLAREIYDRVVAAKGAGAAALMTGEEKIVPGNPRYWICTAEAMPLSQPVSFMAIDEAQLAADPERGHIFTHRMTECRGTQETMILGAETLRPLVRRLVPEAEIETRERFSTLSYAGHSRITALPRRSAIVAFSAEDVYAIAELIRRKRGGAAVVMGALSPRTRNAQVELFQSGEVDYLVATDAIGMGLNLNVDHVAFARLTKFDGRKRRRLVPAEMGQIAGRAGRFRQPGTFGTTGDAPELDIEDVQRLENHQFKPLERLEWRNFDLDFSSMDALNASLNRPTPDEALIRVRHALDEQALQMLSEDPEIAGALTTRASVERLWDICQIPDFRKLTVDQHVKLLKTIHNHLDRDGHLPADWLGAQIARLDKPSGDVDALSARLAHVRTWSYLANKGDWVDDSAHWRAVARDVEDRLSDALHEALTLRFVDRRTSALLRGLREDGELLAGVSAEGEVTVEGHVVGHLSGLTFELDVHSSAAEAKALRNAAVKTLRPEMDRRLGELARAKPDAITMDEAGRLFWKEAPVGQLAPGSDILQPSARLTGGELGSNPAQERARRRLETWLHGEIARVLAPLHALDTAMKEERVTGLARGLTFRLRENLGALDRRNAASEIAQLSGSERRALRAAGVRIGRFSLFVPALLKPEPARLLALLTQAGDPESRHFLPAPGLTSVPARADLPAQTVAAAGFRRCGPRAIRLDSLEALGAELAKAREAAKNQPGFELTPAMTSVLGCSVEDLRGVVKSLGHAVARKPSETEAGETLPELWRRRAAKPRKAKPAPRPPADSPFAALSQLKPARPAPRRKSRAPKRKAEKS
ncbi:DEAD/DEAH box helicase [Euryhalocaulis caribicus]|uniref:DEAD/DEAH box helicase n=1 Tax=Euryhalocaulis caribicus TaxID=1161401 RepID=UPI0003A9A475|nr:DEAD/DEAH box helicase [Euryhalocaulis caribicus]